MAQSITTILAKTAITAAEIEAATNVINYLYLVHGTGSGRSKKIELGELLLFLSRNTKFSVLKLIKDANTDIPLYWDNDNNELVIWDRSNTNGHIVAVPKLHVYGTLSVDKDSFLNGDVLVEKTLTVVLQATFNHDVTFNRYATFAEYANLRKGANIEGKLESQRMNYGSSKSYFEISSNTSINTLLSGTTIEVFKGDIVVLYNTSGNDVTVTLSHFSNAYVEMTLNSKCAMSFICVNTNDYVGWAPIGNATITTRVLT